jgi:hypothetical protein
MQQKWGFSFSYSFAKGNSSKNQQKKTACIKVPFKIVLSNFAISSASHQIHEKLIEIEGMLENKIV